MIWIWAVVIIVLAGAVVVVAVGRGGSMSEVYDDRPDMTIPSGRAITSDDLRDVRFTTAVRGYRMDEVDTLLARLRADLIARESQDAEPDGPAPRVPTDPVPGVPPLAQDPTKSSDHPVEKPSGDQPHSGGGTGPGSRLAPGFAGEGGADA